MAKFGIEIECEIPTYKAVEALNNIEGIHALGRECGYHGSRDFSKWRVEFDRSVRNGCEIVSPILDTETDGFEQIAKVCKALTRAGGRVNVSCGLHVHVGVSAMTVDWLRNILIRYANNTAIIDSFMPRSRRTGSRHAFQYCQNLTGVVNMPAFRTATSVRYLQHVVSRMSAVNIQNVNTLGTVEFRQHSGTLNAEKIENWVTFLVNFVEASRESSETPCTPYTRRGRHTGSRGSTRGQNRGSKRRLLIAALTGENLNRRQTIHYLCDHTGYTEGSLRTTITHLRNDGYNITYNRYRSAFACHSVPTADTIAARRQERRQANSSAPARPTIMDAPTARLWAGVPSDVQTYYVERITDLA